MRTRWPFAAVLFVFTLAADGPVMAQGIGGSRIWIGPPADPERYYRFATDNGNPGTGRYAYFDYNWPSLRQALDEYGLFGRRFRQRNRRTADLCPAPPPPVQNSLGEISK